MSAPALLSAAGAAVSTAARLEAMALAMWRVQSGEGRAREVLVERDGALSGLAELGLHLKNAGRLGKRQEFATIYTRISVLAAALASCTVGAHPAVAAAIGLRLLAADLSTRGSAIGPN